MYGTVSKMKVMPGKLDELLEVIDLGTMDIPGAEDVFVYQMDADSSVLYMVVVFNGREAYEKYSQTSESNDRYERMLPLLDGAPEWNDGQIVFDQRFISLNA